MSGTKVCRNCKVEKPVSDFHKNGTGFKPWCKQCRAEIRKSHGNGRVGREAERRAHLKARYGLTLEEYDMMYKAQQGRCLICLTEHEVLHVDHCHVGGQVRGLLCGPCNKGLGMFKDNKETLQRAIRYLEDK